MEEESTQVEDQASADNVTSEVEKAKVNQGYAENLGRCDDNDCHASQIVIYTMEDATGSNQATLTEDQCAGVKDGTAMEEESAEVEDQATVDDKSSGTIVLIDLETIQSPRADDKCTPVHFTSSEEKSSILSPFIYLEKEDQCAEQIRQLEVLTNESGRGRKGQFLSAILNILFQGVISELKRRDVQEELVGFRIKVWWPADQQYYEGIVESYDPAKKKHRVAYFDGDIENLILKKEWWLQVDEKSDSQRDQVVPSASAMPAAESEIKSKSNKDQQPEKAV